MMHTLRGPARRIAIVQVPRTQLNRLGRIGSIREEDWSIIPSGFTQLTDEPYMPAQPTDASGQKVTSPPTTSQWIASIIQAQSTARESTPGTLIYTPAPRVAAPVVARWNSWAGPCATATPGDASSSAGNGNGTVTATDSTATPPAATGLNIPGILYVAAALGAFASAAYLLDSLTGRK